MQIYIFVNTTEESAINNISEYLLNGDAIVLNKCQIFDISLRIVQVHFLQFCTLNFPRMYEHRRSENNLNQWREPCEKNNCQSISQRLTNNVTSNNVICFDQARNEVQKESPVCDVPAYTKRAGCTCNNASEYSDPLSTSSEEVGGRRSNSFQSKIETLSRDAAGRIDDFGFSNGPWLPRWFYPSAARERWIDLSRNVLRVALSGILSHLRPDAGPPTAYKVWLSVPLKTTKRYSNGKILNNIFSWNGSRQSNRR